MKAAAVALLLTFVFFGVLSTADAGGDITPPVLVAAAADRYQIDTSNGAQTVTLTLHITDDLSGLNYVQISYVQHDGYNANRNCDTWIHSDQATDLTVPCSVTFPRFSAEGKWQVFGVYIVDQVGNDAEYRYSECTALSNGQCSGYEYTSEATDMIRSMVITIGTADPGVDPSLYLPLMAH
jgi:hypothetical protein